MRPPARHKSPRSESNAGNLADRPRALRNSRASPALRSLAHPRANAGRHYRPVAFSGASLTAPPATLSVRPKCNTGSKSSYDLRARTICESPASFLVPYAGDRAPPNVFRSRCEKALPASPHAAGAGPASKSRARHCL